MEATRTKNPSRHWRFSVKNYDTLLPPGPLAEQINPADALAGMRHCMTLRKAEGHFHSAWHHIEYAMNQKVSHFDDQLRQKYIGDAAFLLGKIIDYSASNDRCVNPALYAQALTLNTYLPVFTKRALQKEIIHQDCADIYKSFGFVFKDINSLNYPEASYKSARLAEMIGPALSARTLRPEKLLYPASPREEASTQQPLNHDGYFIKNGEKVPLQTKLIETEKTYDDPTRTIFIEPLAAHALMRAKLINERDRGRMAIGGATEIISTLITEEVDQLIDPQGKAALDFLTRSVVARYEYDTLAA